MCQIFIINPYSGLTTPGVVLELRKNTHLYLFHYLSLVELHLFYCFNINTKIDVPAVRVNIQKQEICLTL
jgi:hypothetical protein